MTSSKRFLPLVCGLLLALTLTTPAAASAAPTVAPERIQQADGVAPLGVYDGRRFKTTTHPAVYLGMCGGLWRITNEAAYNWFFVDWKGIEPRPSLPPIPVGGTLDERSRLVKGPGPEVFVLTSRTIYWISSEAAFKKYHFNAAKIRPVTQAELNGFTRSGCILSV